MAEHHEALASPQTKIADLMQAIALEQTAMAHSLRQRLRRNFQGLRGLCPMSTMCIDTATIFENC